MHVRPVCRPGEPNRPRLMPKSMESITVANKVELAAGDFHKPTAVETANERVAWVQPSIDWRPVPDEAENEREKPFALAIQRNEARALGRNSLGERQSCAASASSVS